MDLCDSLMKWLETFNIDKQVNCKEDLTDGVAMAQILNQISPQFFTTIWLSKIKSDTVNNWRLKVSNLKKMVKGIQDFYSQEIGHPLNDSHMPDVTAIVERTDAKELGLLLKLILGCAVNSNDKHEYIKRIMQMEEDVQLSVMKAIQELMSKEVQKSSTSTESDDQLKKALDNVNKLTEERDIYAQRCHDLDQQVVSLLEEKSNLQTENERLNERLNQAESLDDSNTPAGRRYHLLQRNSEQLQEELYRSETVKDELRMKLEELEKEVYELQQKNEKLILLTEEARNLKDEVDILRHAAEKIGKLEASVETYKKKLDEMSDLKAKLKMVEEMNTTYVQQTMELEEDVKRNTVIKTQLDIYKKQLQESQNKSTEEMKRADKAEFENKRSLEKLTALQREKEHLIEERNSLKEINEDLRCVQLQPPSEGSVDVTDAGLELMSLPPAIREQFLRLQHENKMLKMKSSSCENEEILKTMLDDANTRKHELECQVRSLNQQIMELEARLEDMDEFREKISSEGDSANVEMKKKLMKEMDKCRQLETDSQLFKNRFEEMETKLQGSANEIEKLTEQIKRKEHEIKEMEEKYKKYLMKAKEVIHRLDPKHNANQSGVDVQGLKAQLNEKDRYIESLEKESEKARSQREQEEKLMVTAWYNLAANKNRSSVDDRLSIGNSGQQSFLSRQRQAHVRRTPGNTPGGGSLINSPSR